MKTVFSNHELVHIWANGNQETGKGNSMYFQGKEIFSYGSHFCMAVRVMSEKFNFIYTTRTYSNTTAKHLSLVRGAMHGPILSVPFPNGSVFEGMRTNYSYHSNIELINNELRDHVATIENKRKKPATKETAKNQANWIIGNLRDLAEFHNEDLTKKQKDEGNEKQRLDFLQYAEYFAGNLSNNDLIRSQETWLKKETERKRKEEKRKEKELLERIPRWLSGSSLMGDYIDKIEKTYLRVHPIDQDSVQTSKHAVVTIKAAKVLFHMIQTGKDIKGYTIDGYTVIGINGVLTIGCHKIERDEINRFAALMGWGQIELH